MAFDAFMVINVTAGETLPGESTDKAFPRSCEILEFSFTSRDAESRIRQSIEGTDAVSAGVLSFVESGPTDSASVVAAKDIPGLAKNIDQLDARIDQLEENHKKNFKGLQDATAQLSSATVATTKLLDELQRDVERFEGSAVAAEPSSATTAGVSKQPSSPKVASPKKLSMTLSKYLDSTSPGLLKAYCNAADPKEEKRGETFPFVTLFFRKSGGSNPLLYLKLSLFNVDVTSYSLDSGSGREPPKEALTLSFEKFTVEYVAQSARGSSGSRSRPKIMGWDFAGNKLS
jgi:type VI protein secretion system component Hcp